MKHSIKTIPRYKRALAALQEAVDTLIDERCKTNQPLVIWRNGKVAVVSARSLKRQRAAGSKITD